MKKILLILVIVLLALMIAVPVFADSDHANHPEHNPGQGNSNNHPIPPGWANTDPPGPNAP